MHCSTTASAGVCRQNLPICNRQTWPGSRLQGGGRAGAVIPLLRPVHPDDHGTRGRVRPSRGDPPVALPIDRPLTPTLPTGRVRPSRGDPPVALPIDRSLTPTISQREMPSAAQLSQHFRQAPRSCRHRPDCRVRPKSSPLLLSLPFVVRQRAFCRQVWRRGGIGARSCPGRSVRQKRDLHRRTAPT
jgi:hypothetical protein